MNIYRYCLLTLFISFFGTTLSMQSPAPAKTTTNLHKIEYFIIGGCLIGLSYIVYKEIKHHFESRKKQKPAEFQLNNDNNLKNRLLAFLEKLFEPIKKQSPIIIEPESCAVCLNEFGGDVIPITTSCCQKNTVCVTCRIDCFRKGHKICVQCNNRAPEKLLTKEKVDAEVTAAIQKHSAMAIVEKKP